MRRIGFWGIVVAISMAAASRLFAGRPPSVASARWSGPVDAGPPASSVHAAVVERDVLLAQAGASVARPEPTDSTGAPRAVRVPHTPIGRGAVRTGALAGSCAAVAALLAIDAPTVARLPVVLWFLLACPGLALVPHAQGDRRADWLLLVVATSIAVDALLGLLLIFSGVGISEWSAFVAVAAACAAGVVARELPSWVSRASGGP